MKSGHCADCPASAPCSRSERTRASKRTPPSNFRPAHENVEPTFRRFLWLCRTFRSILISSRYSIFSYMYEGSFSYHSDRSLPKQTHVYGIGWFLLMILAPGLSYSTHLSVSAILRYEMLKAFWPHCINSHRKKEVSSIQTA
jgi:hypothetical protein